MPQDMTKDQNDMADQAPLSAGLRLALFAVLISLIAGATLAWAQYGLGIMMNFNIFGCF